MALQQFHTLQEIIDDIFKLEGVAVNLDYPMTSVKFFKLYSEVYTEQLGSNARVEDLNKRIEDFLQRYGIPQDVYFDPSKNLNLFAVVPDDTKQSEWKLIHIAGYDDFDEGIFEKMNSMEFPSRIAAVHIASDKSMYTLEKDQVN